MKALLLYASANTNVAVGPTSALEIAKSFVIKLAIPAASVNEKILPPNISDTVNSLRSTIELM